MLLAVPSQPCARANFVVDEADEQDATLRDKLL
jgi:hypothetical protein